MLNDLSGKICLVTGANSGIGKATATELAKQGATVFLGCRDKTRGEATQREIMTAFGNSDVELAILDLSLQESIRKMATEFTKTHTLG